MKQDYQFTIQVAIICASFLALIYILASLSEKASFQQSQNRALELQIIKNCR